MASAMIQTCDLLDILHFIFLSVLDDCHLPTDTVDDEGEVGEEVVADHAFGRDVCRIVLRVAAEDLERVARELARDTAHRRRPRPAVKSALVGVAVGRKVL